MMEPAKSKMTAMALVITIAMIQDSIVLMSPHLCTIKEVKKMRILEGHWHAISASLVLTSEI